MKETLERMGCAAGDSLAHAYIERVLAVCKQRTLGYTLFGIAASHEMLVKGEAARARLLLTQLI